MKLLLKLLGVSDYIEELEKLEKEDTETINKLLTEKGKLEINLRNSTEELNELLSTKSTLTAEIIKLREQLETLEQSNSKYLQTNEDLVIQNRALKTLSDEYIEANKIATKEIDKLNKQLIRLEDKFNEFKSDISEAVTNLVCQLNKDYD